MTELKTHKGTMTAKLRCGGTVSCELIEEEGCIRSETILEWHLDGLYYSGEETPFDIVEIVSKPPKIFFGDLYREHKLKEGMVFESQSKLLTLSVVYHPILRRLVCVAYEKLGDGLGYLRELEAVSHCQHTLVETE